jgi:hypothetical protein
VQLSMGRRQCAVAREQNPIPDLRKHSRLWNAIKTLNQILQSWIC